MGFKTSILFSDHRRKDGRYKVYLQVSIDSQRKRMSLDIYWSNINRATGEILPRYPADPDVDDYRVIINDALAKANAIFKAYRLSGKPLTMETFMARWNDRVSKESFTAYFETKMQERLRNKDIAPATYESYARTLKKLKEFKRTIYFADLDEAWAKDFDNFLKRNIASKTSQAINSRWKHHKEVRRFMNLARRDGVNFIYPYSHFRIKPVQGSWEALEQHELITLLEYYPMSENPERKVLRRFLFSCVTGMRLSDLKNFTPDWFRKDSIRFVPWKGRHKQKPVEIPLTDVARILVNDAMAESPKDKFPFRIMSDQKSNEHLKRIGDKLGIRTTMHHHAARHTFATLYLENGGDLRTLQEMLGHDSLETTIIYDHISKQRLRNAGNVLNKMAGALSVYRGSASG